MFFFFFSFSPLQPKIDFIPLTPGVVPRGRRAPSTSNSISSTNNSNSRTTLDHMWRPT